MFKYSKIIIISGSILATLFVRACCSTENIDPLSAAEQGLGNMIQTQHQIPLLPELLNQDSQLRATLTDLQEREEDRKRLKAKG